MSARRSAASRLREAPGAQFSATRLGRPRGRRRRPAEHGLLLEFIAVGALPTKEGKHMSMSMADRDGFIWMDGKLVDWRDARIHVLTHSLHYGMSVFEGVRAYKTANGTAIFRLPEHTRRLMNSAKIFQMKLRLRLRDADARRRRKWSAPTSSRAATCGRSPGSARRSSASRPRATRSTSPSPPGPGAPTSARTASPKASASRPRRSPATMSTSSLVRAKASGYYINSILANSEAPNDGYDEALLLDTEGYVSEGSGRERLHRPARQALHARTWLPASTASPATP